MDPQTRDRMLVALGVVERKFKPGQMRDPHTGKWVDEPGSGAISAALDKLKLAGRINLDDGEELISSGKLNTDNGAVRVAHTRFGDQPSLRFAVEAYDGDSMPRWNGNQSRTAELQAERERLDAERDLLDEDDPRYDELTEQVNQLGEGDDWSTVRLDAAKTKELHTRLSNALAASTAAEKTEKKRWNEIGRLEREQDKLRGDPTREWTAEEEALWDSLTERIEALESAPDVEFDEKGVVSGEWGDVHFHVYFEEVDSGSRVLIGVKPHGVESDWELTRDWKGVFDAAEARKILKLLEPPDSAAARARALRLRTAASIAGAVTR